MIDDIVNHRLSTTDVATDGTQGLTHGASGDDTRAFTVKVMCCTTAIANHTGGVGIIYDEKRIISIG